MLNFNSKKCLCSVSDCGKCLTLGCTDNACDTHHVTTKWRYRKRLLESLVSKVEKLHGDKNKKQLATLHKDINSCEEEVGRLNKILK